MSIEAECELGSERGSPTAARAFVSRMLRLWECTDLDEIACLLTSELVTNAVLHAATKVVLRMHLDPPALRVEVEDGAPDLPQPLPLTPWSEHGRGLWLVEALSRRWGAAPVPPGKIVWFELSALDCGPNGPLGAMPGGLSPNEA